MRPPHDALEGRPWRKEIRAQLRLVVPVVTIQLGLVMMGAVDGAFMGRVSAVEYAAVSIGHTWLFIFLALGMGTLTVLDPVVSQAFGARDEPAMARATQRGLALSVALFVPLALLVLPVESVLGLARIDAEVIPVAASYARASIPGMLPFLVFVALRQSLQAMHLLRPLVFVILCANLLNVLGDWLLIDGHWGFPALGAVGCAWATVIARWSMVFFVLLFASESILRLLVPWRAESLSLRPLLHMLWIGLPIGGSYIVEVGAFSMVGFMMGRLGASELAGHQASLSLSSMSFMIPFGISMAASVRVGNEIGRGNHEGLRRAAIVALTGGIGVMAVAGGLFLAWPAGLARIFTDLPEVVAVAVVLIPIAGLFQVFDGAQGVTVGILRGMADTRVPMLIHTLGFWVIGIPFGAYLAFAREQGAAGLWWGLVLGLVVVALAQFWRLRVVLKKGVRRLQLDPSPPEGEER